MKIITWIFAMLLFVTGLNEHESTIVTIWAQYVLSNENSISFVFIS